MYWRCFCPSAHSFPFTIPSLFRFGNMIYYHKSDRLPELIVAGGFGRITSRSWICYISNRTAWTPSWRSVLSSYLVLYCVSTTLISGCNKFSKTASRVASNFGETTLAVVCASKAKPHPAYFWTVDCMARILLRNARLLFHSATLLLSRH